MTETGFSTYPENIYRRTLIRLLGKTPYRRLSQALILMLLVISPLSFSSENIPNFAYECPVSTRCAVKSRRSVTVPQGLPAGVVRSSANFSVHHIPLAAVTPFLELICFDSPSRSPPA
jgi:hypothetical protein